MFGLGFSELLLVGVVAILLFGKRLPDVARSAGKYYGDFRKGLMEMQRTFNVHEFTSLDSPAPVRRTPSTSDYDDREELSAPRFEPPPPAAGNEP